MPPNNNNNNNNDSSRRNIESTTEEETTTKQLLKRTKSSSSSSSSSSRSATARRKQKQPVQVLLRNNNNRIPKLSPQQYLNALIRSRGYSTTTYPALDSPYYNQKPTKLQLASFDKYLIDLIQQKKKQKGVDDDGDDDEQQRSKRLQLITDIFHCGISSNPCNMYGESLLHHVCRKQDIEILEIMLQYDDCNVSICDGFGRTPLFDACWGFSVSSGNSSGKAITNKPNFDVIKLLIQRDPNLWFMTDCRGTTPLMYVRKEQWSDWLQFLEGTKDFFFPPQQQQQQENHNHPQHHRHPQCRLPLKPPPPPPPPPHPHCRRSSQRGGGRRTLLTVELARLVASGRMTPDEVECLKYMHDDHDDDSSSGKGFDDDDDSEQDYDDSPSSFVCKEEEEGVHHHEEEEEQVRPRRRRAPPEKIATTLSSQGVDYSSSSTGDGEESSSSILDQKEMANILENFALPSAKPISWSSGQSRARAA